MKYLILMILALIGMGAVTALSAMASEPQDSCAKNVSDVVAAQAKLDYPRADLSVPAPNMGQWDGGEVVFLDVPVYRADLSKQIAVYNVMVDETCSVEIQGLDH